MFDEQIIVETSSGNFNQITGGKHSWDFWGVLIDLLLIIVNFVKHISVSFLFMGKFELNFDSNLIVLGFLVTEVNIAKHATFDRFGNGIGTVSSRNINILFLRRIKINTVKFEIESLSIHRSRALNGKRQEIAVLLGFA